MKKRQILILVVLMVFFVLIGGIGIKITNSIKKDKALAQEQSEKIKRNYEEFNELAKGFNEKNKKYGEEIKAVYFTTLEKEEKNLIEQLNDLYRLIEEMENQKQEVDDICKITFTEKEVNQYCETIKISLNAAANVYHTEIEEYNDLIAKYNTWQEENPKYKKLETFKEGSLK